MTFRGYASGDLRYAVANDCTGNRGRHGDLKPVPDLPASFSDAYFWTGVSGVLPEHFVIVTAYNPDALPTAPDLNAAADARLQAELAAGGHEAFRVTGGSRDRAHLEPGWGIPARTPAPLGSLLARRYRQLAFFWISDGDIWLVDTGAGTRSFVARWSERWIRSHPKDPLNQPIR